MDARRDGGRDVNHVPRSVSVGSGARALLFRSSIARIGPLLARLSRVISVRCNWRVSRPRGVQQPEGASEKPLGLYSVAPYLSFASLFVIGRADRFRPAHHSALLFVLSIGGLYLSLSLSERRTGRLILYSAAHLARLLRRSNVGLSWTRDICAICSSARSFEAQSCASDTPDRKVAAVPCVSECQLGRRDSGRAMTCVTPAGREKLSLRLRRPIDGPLRVRREGANLSPVELALAQ